MWQSAGICRVEQTLKNALDRVELWRNQLARSSLNRYVLDLAPQQIILSSLDAEQHLRMYAETSNLLDIAAIILKSALFRTESRGGHYRLDYPAKDANWSVHTILKNEELTTSN